MATTQQRIVTIRAKAFGGDGVKQHRVMVDGDAVRVYDPIAGHYTNCHVLSASAIRRVLKLASK